MPLRYAGSFAIACRNVQYVVCRCFQFHPANSWQTLCFRVRFFGIYLENSYIQWTWKLTIWHYFSLQIRSCGLSSHAIWNSSYSIQNIRSWYVLCNHPTGLAPNCLQFTGVLSPQRNVWCTTRGNQDKGWTGAFQKWMVHTQPPQHHQRPVPSSPCAHSPTGRWH